MVTSRSWILGLQLDHRLSEATTETETKGARGLGLGRRQGRKNLDLVYYGL